jgi:pyrroloquinoline quinone biosynthesis protein B
MFGVLTPDVVRRKTVVAATAFMLPGGLQAQVFTVPGKVPLYLESDSPETASETEANVGTELCAGNARIVYIPGAAAVTPTMLARMEVADIVFFDGTLFRDDEMITTGTGAKTGRRMGHMPIDGEDGSLAALERLSARRVYVHINNTNPILIAGSPERLHVEGKGWEIAHDGMEITL